VLNPSQGHDGIYARCPARWYPARRYYRRDQHADDCDVCDWIGRREIEQHRAKEARRGERSGDADGPSGGDKSEPLPHDQASHTTLIRAKRDTNADLTRARRDGERHHTVDTDRGERQRRDRKKRQQHRTKARLRSCTRRAARHGLHVVHRKRRRDFANGLSNFRAEGGGVAIRPHENHHARPRRLRI
jgi:hypothetical protein